MTPEQFLQWLDSEIEKYTELEDEEYFNEGLMNNYLGQIDALKRIKEKFLTLTPPPTTLS